MTTVNWERLHGDTVQELVSALLLLTNPRGNQITASRGDKGIDIRMWTDEGWEIYQVKRYSRPLTSAQATDVERSWTTFVEETLPSLPVSAWHLVMPWNPSNERLSWLERLTAGHDLVADWIGRTQLDVLAADNPKIVDYYQGNGADRLQELMASALAAGKELPHGAGATQLLGAITARQRELATSLDEVDPFYRYEIQVRPGPLSEEWASQVRAGDDDAALVLYDQIDDDHHVATKILARSPMSSLLRPIAHTMLLDTQGAGAREKVERFRRYGAPLEGVLATTVESVGPPGTTLKPDSTGIVSMARVSNGYTPDLELVIRDSAGERRAQLPLTDIDLSWGTVGRGMRIAGWDETHSLRVEVLMSADEVPDQLSFETTDLAGKAAVQVQPSVDFIAEIHTGHRMEVAFAGGLPIGGSWQLDELDVTNNLFWSKLIQALVEVSPTHIAPCAFRARSPNRPQPTSCAQRVCSVARFCTSPGTTLR